MLVSRMQWRDIKDINDGISSDYNEIDEFASGVKWSKQKSVSFLHVLSSMLLPEGAIYI